MDDNELKIVILKKCPNCKEEYAITLPIPLYKRIMLRSITHERIQDILPNYPAWRREAFITGICDKCWEEVFNSFEDIDDNDDEELSYDEEDFLCQDPR